jgi:hypothetical protein
VINTPVQYNDAEHKYFLGTYRYLSATQIVEHFKEQFDTEERSAYMVERYGMDQQYWKDDWKDTNGTSLIRGNKLHDTQEQFLYNRGYDRIHNKDFVVYNMKLYKSEGSVDYYKWPDGVYPELKAWRHDWHIAGRMDKPIFETINNVRYGHIEDYKTNRKIRREGFNGRTMLGPLRHLQDCEFNHYALQLSIYQYMLEYFGFKPGVRRLIHFPHEIEGLGIPDPVPYEVPYLRQEVISMLGHLLTTGVLN